MTNTNDGPNAPSDDRPNRLHWPPLIYVIVLVAAYFLERFVPLSLLPAASGWQLAGWIVFVSGIIIAIAGVVQFRSVGTPIDPTGRAKVLATGGIYQVTRNPMYLGATVAFLGLAVALGSAWLLILTVVMPIALQKLAIDREEAYLQRRFGTAYDDYRSKVRRWV